VVVGLPYKVQPRHAMPVLVPLPAACASHEVSACISACTVAISLLAVVPGWLLCVYWDYPATGWLQLSSASCQAGCSSHQHHARLAAALISIMPGWRQAAER
jgi:hypothetical protein